MAKGESQFAPFKFARGPHDLFFKVLLSDVEILLRFLRYTVEADLLSDLDLSQLRKVDTVYVSKHFGTSVSDLAYETHLLGKEREHARVVILFEHKSVRHVVRTFLQMYNYQGALWEDDRKNGRPLTLVLPILFYHGERPWNEREFWECFQHPPSPQWRRFVPNFEMVVLDLSRVTVDQIEQLESSDYLRMMLLTFKFARDWRQLAGHFRAMAPVVEMALEEERGRLVLRSWIFYLENMLIMNEAEFDDFKGKVSPDAYEAFLMLKKMAEGSKFGEDWKKAADEYFEEKARREGMERGLQRGLQEGLQQGLQQGMSAKTRTFVINLLKKFPDWSDAEIAEIAETTEEEVAQLRQSLTKNGSGNGEHA